MDEKTKHSLDRALEKLERSATELAYAVGEAHREVRDADFHRKNLDDPDAIWKSRLDETRNRVARFCRAWAVGHRAIRAAGWPKDGE